MITLFLFSVFLMIFANFVYEIITFGDGEWAGKRKVILKTVICFLILTILLGTVAIDTGSNMLIVTFLGFIGAITFRKDILRMI